MPWPVALLLFKRSRPPHLPLWQSPPTRPLHHTLQMRAITRHDGAEAAALAGCNPSLLRSTRIAGPDVLPFQVRRWRTR